MERDLTVLCSKILDYSNALSSLFLEDYKKLLTEEFAELSTKQQVVLELLGEKNRTINEIAQFLSITASAASQLISKLEKQGYVKREINFENRREIIVQLGEKGHHYHQSVEKGQLFIIEKYYARLPKDDLERLLEIQEKLYHLAVEAQKE
ncbi:MarR family winged helix-turn-helix transcriptional regulator [Neobacillus niacini]|jgi:MarR family transcriptional regulator, organic hydroperoxide resistance regulator|uniref:MarR family winged helix-turn-helix transcriptional regulator n=1 Tax=Neobacillus niacini TaxID=86668 RepID=UPI001C8E7020|nr:MarR family transcriptional regulator [Neobacillus niacini]MBY0147725.1 MarR family transcriptional regulator [Neobacillus niacini]